MSKWELQRRKVGAELGVLEARVHKFVCVFVIVCGSVGVYVYLCACLALCVLRGGRRSQPLFGNGRKGLVCSKVVTSSQL